MSILVENEDTCRMNVSSFNDFSDFLGGYKCALKIWVHGEKDEYYVIHVGDVLEVWWKRIVQEYGTPVSLCIEADQSECQH